MFAYRDFVQDFPERCYDVLKEFSSDAAKVDREATLLIMAAIGRVYCSLGTSI